MRTYKTLKAAIKDMPSCLTGSHCGDALAIAMQARRDAENPLAILRDLVRTELDLIDEAEVDYGREQKKWIRNYWNRLITST